MARNNKVISSDFCKAVKTAVNDLLEKGDMETCVNTSTIAEHKALAKGFAVSHPERLRLLVMTAVSVGQVPGLDLRTGRNGGVFRVPVKKAKSRTPASVKKAKPVNDTVEETQAAEETKQAVNA